MEIQDGHDGSLVHARTHTRSITQQCPYAGVDPLIFAVRTMRPVVATWSAGTSAFSPEYTDLSGRRQPQDQGVPAAGVSRIGDPAQISQAVSARTRHES
jgi:hypothetical protein